MLISIEPQNDQQQKMRLGMAIQPDSSNPNGARLGTPYMGFDGLGS